MSTTAIAACTAIADSVQHGSRRTNSPRGIASLAFLLHASSCSDDAAIRQGPGPIYQSSYRYFANLAADLGLDNVPMTDEARKIHAARATGLLGYEEPDAHCLPQGVPKINMAPVPFRIVQTDTLVVLVYEAFNLWRQVHLDGRDWADDLNPSWMGYSKGRWEGDTLVVETRGLNGKQWLDHGGLPASDKLTVVERFRRPTFGTLEIDIAITDPTYYTKPWTATPKLRLVPDTELFEFICNENERSRQHMGPHITGPQSTAKQ